MTSLLNLPIASDGRPCARRRTCAQPRRRLPVDFVNSDAGLDGLSLSDAARILTAADAILNQGAQLLRVLTIAEYTQRIPCAFNASIGGHYRHTLDHFASVLRALDSSEVDYDHRARDRRIESDLASALELTERLREGLQRLGFDTLVRAVHARCEVSYEHGASPLTISTCARELVYAISHAIHHFALIGVMARLSGLKLPPNFGVAPSTLAHQNHSQ